MTERVSLPLGGGVFGFAFGVCIAVGFSSFACGSLSDSASFIALTFGGFTCFLFVFSPLPCVGR